jgi:hypothetical protein
MVTPVTPEVCADHVDPLFVVPTTTPASPVAIQVLLLEQAMPQRLLMVPEACDVQFTPPSVLAITEPLEPTA